MSDHGKRMGPPDMGEIHLWCVHYGDILDQQWPLSNEESQRKSKFKFKELGEKYAQRTGALRCLLGYYIGVLPGEIKFEFNQYDKPYLGNDSDVTFNMSHSRDWFCMAVGRMSEIGCDIERVDEHIEHDDLIDQYFSPIEQAEYLSFSAEEKPEIFFNLWTRKEAFIKAVGQGLSFGLDRFSVEAHNTTHPLLLEVKNVAFECSDFQLRAFDHIPGYKSCVAFRGELKQVRLFDSADLNAILQDVL